MLVGYARTSTLEQEAGLDAQIRDLKGVGCNKLFREQVTSVGARKELEAALEFCREGDTLVVTKLAPWQHPCGCLERSLRVGMRSREHRVL